MTYVNFMLGLGFMLLFELSVFVCGISRFYLNCFSRKKFPEENVTRLNLFRVNSSFHLRHLLKNHQNKKFIHQVNFFFLWNKYFEDNLLYTSLAVCLRIFLLSFWKLIAHVYLKPNDKCKYSCWNVWITFL